MDEKQPLGNRLGRDQITQANGEQRREQLPSRAPFGVHVFRL
jgi:hypothetical protein